MTRIGRRLIEDFLLPALNDQKYGDLLKWVDREKRYFSIRWSHKNAAKWTLADTIVFQDWDKLKGHYHPEIKGYYMQAKQRFRAALYKLNSVKKLSCEDKHVKKYQLILDHDKRRPEFLANRHKLRIPKKEENQKSIPTSVIRKNTSYIEKPKPVYQEMPSSAPSSPASSIKSETSSDKEELEKCLSEYTQAQKKQMMLSISNSKKFQKACTKEDTSTKEKCESSVLKENSFGLRVHQHVPTQPIPVYSSSIMRQMYESCQQRYESPQILLVKTYNEEDDQKIKDEPVEVECIVNESNVLNLCVKSDNSEPSSR